ncbi:MULTISPECIES: hypothetical protein [unclassified Bradyrhizobium]|uniref:hypothetical protein n=1 Tax=unclassified Bradyrhizobium TaxID=2631580 RepID=UPI00291658AE|nr:MULTISPECIES: hypothetical protein [unclassified Bradyrhizobium]
MVTVESKFIGDFKLGDNINHNLKILALLYEQYAKGDEAQKKLLCKPITLLLVSIVDAVLYDLHWRIRTFTKEGVRNILKSSIEYIRSLKKMDTLEKYIASAKMHALLGPSTDPLYADLDTLRRLRNRIHIQNTKKDFEADEINAFNAARKTLAEEAVEKTLKTMAEKYARETNFVEDFMLPWEPH